jgi:hypothetical protein
MGYHTPGKKPVRYRVSIIGPIPANIYQGRTTFHESVTWPAAHRAISTALNYHQHRQKLAWHDLSDEARSMSTHLQSAPKRIGLVYRCMVGDTELKLERIW